jgi:hypothetical protein
MPGKVCRGYNISEYAGLFCRSEKLPVSVSKPPKEEIEKTVLRMSLQAQTGLPVVKKNLPGNNGQTGITESAPEKPDDNG